MPNWCVGTLKVRGKVEDIKRFVSQGLHPVDFLGNKKEPIKIEEHEGYCECNCDVTCWIENTRRGFVDHPDIYFDYETDDEIKIICLSSRFAWGIDSKQLLETCKKYNVDMKIYAFERGMEFNQNIEIVNAQIVKDETIEFKDYEWECICPDIGG